jgi:eukaryotic-like serine/threonine-protein kinase
MALEIPRNDPTLLMTVFPCEGDCETALQSRSLFYRNGEEGARSCDFDGLTSFDEYALLEEIDRGGMGVVYKARDCQLDRLVAIKLMLPSRALRVEAIEQFLAEAAIASELNHPGIVAVEAVGHSNGQPYICMELVEGESLAKRLKRGRLEAAEAACLLSQVADAVQHMHDRGILHRDLKPANILLDRSGQPRVADFGLAMQFAKNAAGSEIARSQQTAGDGSSHPAESGDSRVLRGTPLYMSPEQASGDIDRLGPASDIYALGTVLYECLTGRTPFLGTQVVGVIGQVIGKEPPSPTSIEPSIPGELEKIVLRCLQKAPSERFASAGELACELRRIA